MYYWYFKLFNNIKSEQEANELAKLELENLFGKVEPIFNFADKLCEEPLCKFMNLPERLQDYIIYELPYGRIQGYFGKSEDVKALPKLVKRLAYTREIYLITYSFKSPEQLLKTLFPEIETIKDKIFSFFKFENYVCFRFITYQYFLEKSEYISKLSRNEEEIEKNVKILFSYLKDEIYRIPASTNLSIGKRLQDYFAIREEPSLYLTHYFHPYKGKFHPKMVRALLNCIYSKDKGIILDNFAGSGTLLVEATLIELNSIGIEINPLSVLMSNVKCKSLLINITELKKEINEYFYKIKDLLKSYQSIKSGQLTFELGNNVNFDEVNQKSEELSIQLKSYFKNKNEVIPQILLCREIIEYIKEKPIKDFLSLVLSGAISDITRRTDEDFLEIFQKRVSDLYLRLFLFKKLNEVLKISPGISETYVADAKNMWDYVKTEEIDGIVTSPPYSVALDYIKNDFPQLILMELVKSFEELNKNMIGNPRLNYYKNFSNKTNNENDFSEISETAKDVINTLLSNQREQTGLRTYKFFVDMHQSLKEMFRVMKKGSKCAIVIGNNHFVVNNKILEIPNDKIILEIAKKIGFTEYKFIKHKLQKTSEGNIKEESIIIIQKD